MVIVVTNDTGSWDPDWSRGGCGLSSSARGIVLGEWGMVLVR